MVTTTPKKRKPGRPAKYTNTLATAICQRLAGGESLRAICEGADMPDRTTVADSLARHPEFSRQYAHAREIGFDHLAELTLAEATNVTGDKDRIAAARLTWDARRWHLSKMLPKRYCERIAQEHSGP
jgi:hypothetical protein